MERRKPPARRIPEEQPVRAFPFLPVLSLVLLSLLALVPRLLHLAEIGGDLLLKYPLVDEEYYFKAGAQLARGKDLPPPYWEPPGLHFVLALILRFFGESVFHVRLIQVLLSAAACLLAWALARRYVDRSTALLAAAFLALHGAVIDAAIDIKSTTWELFLDVLGLLLLTDAARKGSRARAVAAGLVFGISALFRPTLLLFLPFAFWWLLERRQGTRRPVLSVLFALALLAPIAPIAWRNSRASGRPVLISTNGGVNFFIGNNPAYRATVTARPGNQWTLHVLEPASRAGYPAPTPERDSFYYRRGLESIAEDPAGASLRFMRKAYLFLSGFEIPRDTDVYLHAEDSRVLGSLVRKSLPPFPGGILMPLALLGLVPTWARRRERMLLLAFPATQMLISAIWFAASRYRIPSLPLLCILAACGARWLLTRIRTGGIADRSLPVLCFLALVIALNVPTFETRQSLRAERLYFLGNALVLEQRHAEALQAYRSAVLLDSTDARPWKTIEAIMAKDRNWEQGAAAMRRAIALGPYDARDHDRLVDLLVMGGDTDGAIREILAELSSRAGPPARRADLQFRLGTLHYERGDLPNAESAFREALITSRGVSGRLASWAERRVRTEVPSDSERERFGAFWFRLAGWIGEGPDPRRSIPLWRHASELLARDEERRAIIAGRLRQLGER
jgi:4-amino-4-deoxy-L-arabinose transferase-like glycosyltransferase